MFDLPKFGDGIGLHRIERFFAAHAIDTARLSRRSIAVTGSNGKGSTTRFIAGALQANGRRVGCFTSPHLFDLRERFLIGDTPIPQAAFDAYAQKVIAFNATLPVGDRMGAFEFLFLVAILWFEDEAPDAIVWEAGIGGRYDPVRTVRAKVSTITSIELEHTELLGSREELIAYDKADALAPGGVLILSPAINAQLASRIISYVRLSGRTAAPAQGEIHDATNTPDGAAFIYHAPQGDIPVQLSLIGRHQIDNALTALDAALAWEGATHSDPRLPAMLAGIRRTTWPGRLQKVASSPDLWIDVGHTPVALDLVTDAFLDLVPRDRTLIVFGVSASKEVMAIANIVATKFDRFILTRAHKAGADPAMFAPLFAGKAATIAPDTTTAARLAQNCAASENLAVLAIGGLFLAAEITVAWKGGDPSQLNFM